jgi:hypothetical protein
MRPSRQWTAEDWKRANIENPLPSDHKGRKDHSNEQTRFELFLLGPGEKKVMEEPDTSESSSISFLVLIPVRDLCPTWNIINLPAPSISTASLDLLLHVADKISTRNTLYLNLYIQ